VFALAGCSDTAVKGPGPAVTFGVLVARAPERRTIGAGPGGEDTTGMNDFKACPQPRQEVVYTTYPGTGHVDSWPMPCDLSAGHDRGACLLTKLR
jgi:hypothetical protein